MPTDERAQPPPPLKLLLIEDSPADALLIKELLAAGELSPVELTYAERLDQALRLLARDDFSAILLDLNLTDSAGLETFTLTRASAPTTAMVVLTSQGDEQLAQKAVHKGAQDYLVKGSMDGVLLSRTVRHAIQRQYFDETLRASERRYRALVDGSIQGILIHVNGVVRLANPSLARMLGYDGASQFVGATVWPFIALQDKELVVGHMRARMRGEAAPSHYQFRVVRRDAAVVWVDCLVTTIVWNGELAILATMVDITEKRALEEQFRQAQKLEAVGRLAGGIAHDFNNVLTVITAFSDFLVQDLGDGDPCREHVNEIRKAADAASTLTQHLLAFSRQQILEPKVLILNEIVRDAEKLLKPLMGDAVELNTALDEALGRVRVDAGQFVQVIMNLALNARDAMPDGGTLTIETTNVEFTQEYVREHLPAAVGRYVMLALSDTGVGMDEQTRTRVFEPFFTTKAAGAGTGLGLAMVYGTVKQSGGFIWVYSEPGCGTTFKIYLPCVEEPVTPHISVSAPNQGHGTETILLVEDDAAVRAIARLALERRGYSVLEAQDGESAQRLTKEHSGRIHLLLADIVMPGMSGRHLAEQLKDGRRDLKVLYMSGYTDDVVIRRSLLERGAAYLQKPFTPDALALRVREVLDSM